MNKSLIELEKKRNDMWNCNSFLKRDCNFNSRGPITTYIKLIAEPKDRRILKSKHCSWNCITDNKFRYLKSDAYNDNDEMGMIELKKFILEDIRKNESANLIFE